MNILISSIFFFTCCSVNLLDTEAAFPNPEKCSSEETKLTYAHSVKYVCHLFLTSLLIPSRRSAPYFLHLCTHPPTILPVAHLRPKSSLPLETVVIRPTSKSQRGETNNTHPAFTQTEPWRTPQRACVWLWMGVTEIKMDGARLLAFVWVFFFFFHRWQTATLPSHPSLWDLLYSLSSIRAFRSSSYHSIPQRCWGQTGTACSQPSPFAF